MTQSKTKFGTAVRTWRTDRGMTQKYLAAKIGITQEQLSHIENGHNEPNLVTAKKISDYVGVPLQDLTEGRV